MQQQEENRVQSVINVLFLTAFLIAGQEMISALLWFKNDMGIIEVLSHASGTIPYYLWLIIVLLGIFPLVICIFRQRSIRLSEHIIRKESLVGDIIFGALAGVITFLINYVLLHVVAKIPIPYTSFSSFTILQLISLVFVSGLLKEIYFRGMPMLFLKERLGESNAFLIGNILFAIVDWPNLGLSFIYGFIWYSFYKKRGTIIVPAIAHGLSNLLVILVRLGVLFG